MVFSSTPAHTLAYNNARPLPSRTCSSLEVALLRALASDLNILNLRTTLCHQSTKQSTGFLSGCAKYRRNIRRDCRLGREYIRLNARKQGCILLRLLRLALTACIISLVKLGKSSDSLLLHLSGNGVALVDVFKKFSLCHLQFFLSQKFF